MIRLEAVTNGTDLVAINRMPRVYRPVGGPKTIAWMRAKGFIDRRRFQQATDAYWRAQARQIEHFITRIV